MTEATYDRIGVGYRDIRRPDPRIAARIEEALGGARTVLNVGAGTGSYEPVDREVMAVEPSEVMIAQRPAGSAPVVRARAEAVPFKDDSFDAAMAIITVHHWDDPAAGLGEMIRVARERVVVLTFDPTPLRDFWFGEYFPRALDIHSEFMPPVEELAEMLGGASVEAVPLPRRCTDGFFFALWDRPEMHLDPEVRRGSTVWHVMDAAEVERGLDALRADLESGAWDGRYGHLRAEPELDVGLRLVVAEAAASSCSRQRGTSCPILPGSPGKTTSSVGTPTSTWLAARGSSSSSTPARSWRTGTVGCWAPARLLTR